MASKTTEILDLFEQISRIPRCSGNEAALAAWLQAWATNNSFSSKTDAAGNVVIQVPGSKGYEKSPTVVLQGHMDMVCEKTPESQHNFATDAIQNITDGEWLRADNTTLGSDNGIAIAFAMAAATDPQISHPPLELLFTVREEVGLSGVNELKPGFIEGKTLINLDSEEEGTFIVGCAGGETTHLTLPVEFAPATGEKISFAVEGLRGGHSGVDIAKNFANANKLLARVLASLSTLGTVRIAQIGGGTAHNAISRNASAVVFLPAGTRDEAKKMIDGLVLAFQKEHAGVEQNLRIAITPAEAASALTEQSTRKVIDLLNALPHGVANMSYEMPGFVETSSNVASIKLSPDQLKVITSQRSTSMSRLKEIRERFYAIGRLAGATVTTESAYPSWNPNLASPVLQACQASFRRLFGSDPNIMSIHAGLECSTIGELFPGIDMVSIGVTIENPHSPTERMHIPSVEKVWLLLADTLASLK